MHRSTNIVRSMTLIAGAAASAFLASCGAMPPTMCQDMSQQNCVVREQPLVEQAAKGMTVSEMSRREVDCPTRATFSPAGGCGTGGMGSSVEAVESLPPQSDCADEQNRLSGKGGMNVFGSGCAMHVIMNCASETSLQAMQTMTGDMTVCFPMGARITICLGMSPDQVVAMCNAGNGEGGNAMLRPSGAVIMNGMHGMTMFCRPDGSCMIKMEMGTNQEGSRPETMMLIVPKGMNCNIVASPCAAGGNPASMNSPQLRREPNGAFTLMIGGMIPADQSATSAVGARSYRVLLCPGSVEQVKYLPLVNVMSVFGRVVILPELRIPDMGSNASSDMPAATECPCPSCEGMNGCEVVLPGEMSLKGATGAATPARAGCSCRIPAETADQHCTPRSGVSIPSSIEVPRPPCTMGSDESKRIRAGDKCDLITMAMPRDQVMTMPRAVVGTTSAHNRQDQSKTTVFGTSQFERKVASRENLHTRDVGPGVRQAGEVLTEGHLGPR